MFDGRAAEEDASTKFDYREEWGEQYKGRVAPTVVLCCVDSGRCVDVVGGENVDPTVDGGEEGGHDDDATMSCGQPAFATSTSCVQRGRAPRMSNPGVQ